MIARRIEAAEGKDELPATASANGGSGRAHEQTADTAERKRFLVSARCSSKQRFIYICASTTLFACFAFLIGAIYYCYFSSVLTAHVLFCVRILLL